MAREYRCTEEGCKNKIAGDVVERRVGGNVRILPGAVFCVAHLGREVPMERVEYDPPPRPRRP